MGSSGSRTKGGAGGFRYFFGLEVPSALAIVVIADIRVPRLLGVEKYRLTVGQVADPELRLDWDELEEMAIVLQGREL